MSTDISVDMEGGKGSALPPIVGISLWAFPLLQSQDDTLRYALDQLKVIDGHSVEPNIALSYPYFKDR